MPEYRVVLEFTVTADSWSAATQRLVGLIEATEATQDLLTDGLWIYSRAPDRRGWPQPDEHEMPPADILAPPDDSAIK